ncbi:MAG: methylenetetrahydrofolate reductase [NAD(P)H] [Betaproteobacteria bacterium]|nr:MAG: methylenetetrahydrofolate reductase [NAD(P)H] [Betaproteobacteria bacterium]
MNNISFEFFPPNTPEGEVKLRAVTQDLMALAPKYFSVTYGAGGSTRDKTLATVKAVADAGNDVAPHLSCVGATKESVRELLHLYRDQGIKRMVALGGDVPSGMVAAGDFRYATDLVSFIREETGDHFALNVAAYPEVHPRAATAKADLAALKLKQTLGADVAVTQFFYNADAYFAFVDAALAEGITMPIIAGVMPLHSYSKVARFAEMCGAEMPRWLNKRMADFGDDSDSVRALGLDVVSAMCERLIAGGAPGIHFYTMNQSALTKEIVTRLRNKP